MENASSAEQIAYADTIVLNKSDLVETEEEMERIKERLESINADAKLVISERSRVDLSFRWIKKSYKGNVKSRLIESKLKQQSFRKRCKDLATLMSGSKHDETITTVCLTAKGFVDKEKV